jgi:glycosyltransferase involved in cell wall biosynthesis
MGAKKGWKLRGQIVGSAWGSDILVTPQRGPHYRWVTTQVLKSCVLTTSDSEHMAAQMRKLGAGEVRVFPFGLEKLPPTPARKAPWTFFANRGLEPIYRPDRVITAFASVVSAYPEARLTIANDGSLRAALEQRVGELGLANHIEFVGRLGAEAQAHCYERAQWYLSMPSSDSVAVSVLEAMAHGCIPLLSDLPANHELVRSGLNGLILTDAPIELMNLPQQLAPMLSQATRIGRDNHEWVRLHGQFAPAVEGLLTRLAELM